MESRMDKYYREDNSMQRTSKNAKLYRDVYQDYDSLDNLPIPDNTNEIDIPALRKLMQNTKEENNKTRENKYIEEDKPKEKINAEKIHDINKLLEYAKNENNKLKENNHNENTSNYRLLETLENKTLTKSDIEHSIHPINNKDNIKEEELSQTRELKYQTKKISENPVIEQIIPEDSKEVLNTASLSLDILSDLKPTGNTGVTEPVKDPMFEKIYEEDKKDINNSVEEVSIDDKSEEDINIIKDDVNIDKENEEKDSSFYTDMYKFSNKDFEDDDEEESNGGFIFKIILLIIFIAICGFAIFYFVSNYGLN